MITIQESLINQLGSILKDFGLELVRVPIDQNIHSVHRVTYRFTELGRQSNHKTDSNPLRWVSYHTAHIEFKLSTPDLVLATDFKNRYQNRDLLTNFCEFYTNDKLGRSWVSSIWWNPIDTSFTQDYDQDEQSNIAFESSFSADINYCIVYDERYYNISKSIIDIINNQASIKV